MESCEVFPVCLLGRKIAFIYFSCFACRVKRAAKELLMARYVRDIFLNCRFKFWRIQSNGCEIFPLTAPLKLMELCSIHYNTFE